MLLAGVISILVIQATAGPSNSSSSGSGGANQAAPISTGGATTQLIKRDGTMSSGSQPFAVSSESTLTGEFEIELHNRNGDTLSTSHYTAEVIVLTPDQYALMLNGSNYTYPSGCDSGNVAQPGFLTSSCVLEPGNYYLTLRGSQGDCAPCYPWFTFWPNGLVLTKTGK